MYIWQAGWRLCGILDECMDIIKKKKKKMLIIK
jgi:hypothetical protein